MPMKKLIILIGAMIFTTLIIPKNLCFATDLFTGYSLIKNNEQIDRIEHDPPVVNGHEDYRFRVFVKQYNINDGTLIEPKEVIVSVGDLKTRKAQLQEQIVEIQAQIVELDKMIVDFMTLVDVYTTTINGVEIGTTD